MKLPFLVVILPFLLINCTPSLKIPHSSVMITNLESNSGGSGTIIYSSDHRSDVLTNKHVCGVVENGGLVHDSRGGQHLVDSYKLSQSHDLCVLSTLDNLGPAAQLASAPADMYDRVTVAGHPHLLPEIVTEGYMSSSLIITVVIGKKECTERDKQDPATGFLCALVGYIVDVKNYEAVVLSAMIQPGSSGSAVFNSDGEIVAVIFAGKGDLGYGFAVPYKYVYNFLTNELNKAEVHYPGESLFETQNRAQKTPEGKETKTKWLERIKELCNTTDIAKQVNLCDTIKNAVNPLDLIQRKIETISTIRITK